MKHRARWSIVLAGAAIAAGAQSVPPATGASTPNPQLIPRTAAERQERYNTLHRILLNVQVTDASGHPVEGLTAQDFTLRMNGQPLKIATFHAVRDGGSSARAHAFFLIDTLNYSARDLAYSRNQVEKFLHSLPGPLSLPVSLAVLTDDGIQIGTPSRDGQALLPELARATSGIRPVDCTEDWNDAAIGMRTTLPSVAAITADNRESVATRMASCLNDKFRVSVVALRDFAHQQVDVPGRAILIWVGPGWPRLSGPGFAPDTPHLRQNFFANLVDLSNTLREAQVTLDMVSWPVSSPIAATDSADLQALYRGTPTSDMASADSFELPVLAHLSGGLVFLNQKNLAAAFAASLSDADSYYVLAADSNPSLATDEFRTIEVTIDRPGVTARTTTSYYAQP